MNFEKYRIENYNWTYKRNTIVKIMDGGNITLRGA